MRIRTPAFCGFTSVVFLLALMFPKTMSATLLSFNTGPFYGLLGSIQSPTVPNSLQVSFAAPVSFDAFVMITSSDPSRLDIVGGGVTVPAGQSSAVVLVNSVTPGSVTVTAYFQDQTATNTVSVVSEIPAPPPSLNIELLSGAVRLTWPTNANVTLLETNSNLTNPTGWGVLTTNYSILSTNFSVVAPLSSPAQFYRLRLP